jgi:hypothetical protein
LIKSNRFKISITSIYVEPYYSHPYCHISDSNISFEDIYILGIIVKSMNYLLRHSINKLKPQILSQILIKFFEYFFPEK